MKTAILTTEGFEFREQDMPSCADDQIIVKTSACGICDGDVFQRKSIVDGEIELGHEGSGIVHACGSAVSEFSVGDKVTALAGPYAEYFTCTADELVKLPAGVEPEWALGEPIACFVHAARRFGISPGQSAAIIGCGFMGIGCLQMAAIQGASRIVAIEPVAWRRSTAQELGATECYDPSGKSPEEILEALGEFDVIIEATGIAPAIDISTALVKQHGRIVLVGYHQSENGMRTVDMKTWNFKAIDVMNGHVRRDDEKLSAMREGMQLLSEGKLKINPLNTFYDFAEINTAFGELIDRKEGLYKATLKF
ncbi:MAG: zinc-binding dehydrogenase [Planctomycetes bacterium]|nr:zinc-binding dehydrogenase [Planctomycetota bacterium]